MERCNRFAGFLEETKYVRAETLYEFPDYCVVDFGDKELEDALKKRDPRATPAWTSRGSISIGKDSIKELEVPISLMSANEGREGYYPLKIPTNCWVEEVHTHDGTGIPSVHIHMGCFTNDDEMLKELKKFIEEANKIARTFAGLETG